MTRAAVLVTPPVLENASTWAAPGGVSPVRLERSLFFKRSATFSPLPIVLDVFFEFKHAQIQSNTDIRPVPYGRRWDTLFLVDSNFS